MSFISPLQNVIVQKGYLEKKFQPALEAELGFDLLAEIDPIEARVGEAKVLTRRAILPPITQDVVPSPTVFTDLNNGITPQQVTYEQYVTAMAKRRGMMTLDLELDWAKIASEYVKNWTDLAKQAAQSRDSRAAAALFSAYDGGNTYATAASTGTTTATVAIDNVNGFDTSYAAAIAAGASPGVPVGVSASNPLAVTIISQQAATMNQMMAALVTNVAPDATNLSTAYSPGAPYGRSGVLTLVSPTSGATITVALGDVVKANDGSVVLRPYGKLSRGQLQGTDLATLPLLARAKGRLQARSVPPLPNKMYACMIDSLLWADLEQDQAFQRATQGTWGGVNSFFASGRVNTALGIEFVTTSLNPVYPIPGQPNVVARHALVCGMGVLVKSPSIGFERAAKASQGNDEDGVDIGRAGATDVRIVDGVKMVTRQPLDPEATVVTQTWSWAMGHVAATDITSTPQVIPQTDNARFKRAVLIEIGSQS